MGLKRSDGFGDLETKLNTGGKFVRNFATGLVGMLSVFLLNSVSKADEPIPFSNYTVTAVTGQDVTNSTISPEWRAWGEVNDDASKIYYINKSDVNTIHELPFDNISNPNVDGDTLVCDSPVGIYAFNLSNNMSQLIYPAFPGEVCSSPKKNGYDVIFHVKKEESDEIYSYNMDEEMAFPITHSSNEKGKPDIFGYIVAWPELETGTFLPDKISSPNWDVKYYDTRTGREGIVDNNSNFSSDSCAVTQDLDGDPCILYAQNGSPFSTDPNYDPLECTTTLHVFYPDTGMRRGPADGETAFGDIHNLAFSGNAIIYEQTGRFTGKTIIGSMLLSDWRLGEKSQGHNITDSADGFVKPDIYRNPQTGAVCYSYSRTGGGTVGVTEESSEPVESILELFSASESQYAFPRCDGLLLEHDLNDDNYVNLKDYAMIAEKWIEEYDVAYLESFSQNWLRCRNPNDERCENYNAGD